eukprot:11677460-Heterocapsa_arctica.AAC.1
MYWTSASCWLKAGVLRLGIPTRKRTAWPDASVTRRRSRVSASQAIDRRAARTRGQLAAIASL